MTPQQKAKKDREATVFAKAAQKSQEGVVQDIAKLKVNITTALDSIANGVAAELTTLQEVQEAVEAKRNELKELYGIEAQANTLVDLKQKEDLQRATWQAERDATQVSRIREEEQYQYDIGKKHRDQEAEFRLKLDQESERHQLAAYQLNETLNSRQTAIAAKEEELSSLRSQVCSHQEQLKKEVERAVAIATNSLKKDLTNEHQLAKLSLENELKLKNAEIQALDSQLSDLGNRYNELNQKYQSACDKVQQIAEKAIEGASKQSVIVQASGNEPSNGRK